MNYQGTNGKGSKRRPMQVGREQFEANWEAIFGKKETAPGPTSVKGHEPACESDADKSSE
jgi:hypothetical protein